MARRKVTSRNCPANAPRSNFKSFHCSILKVKTEKKIIFKKSFFGCMIMMMMEMSRYGNGVVAQKTIIFET